MLSSKYFLYTNSSVVKYTSSSRKHKKTPSRESCAPRFSRGLGKTKSKQPTPRSCLKKSSEPTKKTVVFADELGKVLEEVKLIDKVRFIDEVTSIDEVEFMVESPCLPPPLWTFSETSDSTQDRKTPQKQNTWQLKFFQPASDYARFLNRITQDNISLETVVLNEKTLDGTVFVRNLDFTEEVFVRSTSDYWRTHIDTCCAFMETGAFGKDTEFVYDRFCFRIHLPLDSERMELCVYFLCKGEEYWDNNNSRNYVVEKSIVTNTVSIKDILFARTKRYVKKLTMYVSNSA